MIHSTPPALIGSRACTGVVRCQNTTRLSAHRLAVHHLAWINATTAALIGLRANTMVVFMRCLNATQPDRPNITAPELTMINPTPRRSQSHAR